MTGRTSDHQQERASETIQDALERFATLQAAEHPNDRDVPQALALLAAFLEDFGSGYLTGEDETTYERAMIDGLEHPFARTARPDVIPAMVPEFLNDYLMGTFEGDPEDSHEIAEVTRRLVAWLADEGLADRSRARVAETAAKRAADQLPRAMVLGTLLDRQADRNDRTPRFEPGEIVDGLLRIAQIQPGMLWFEDGIGPVPVGEAASRVAEVGWWVDIAVGRKGGSWHVLEVGAVFPERIGPG